MAKIDFYPTYNGKRYTEKGLAKIVYQSVETNTAKANTDYMAWLKNNCENLNEVAVATILETIWYNHIGIYNKNIEKRITELVASEVENGNIAEW